MQIAKLPPCTQGQIEAFMEAISEPIYYLGGDGKGWQKTVAWNPVAMFSSNKSSNSNHSDFLAFVDRHSKQKRKIVGYVSYDAGKRQFNLPETGVKGERLPDLFCAAFDNFVTFAETETRVYCNDPSFLKQCMAYSKQGQKNAKSKNAVVFNATMDYEYYADSFRKIKQHITDGDVYQLNFTQVLEATTSRRPRELFAQLMAVNNVSYQAYLELEEAEILSVSPECFIKTHGKTIETYPVKGTMPRGKNQEQDNHNRRVLATSEKETAELNMITDLLRNDMGKVCEVGSVEVVGGRVVTPYTSVWHAHSHVRGRLLADISPIEALLSMSPGGSITGCPKKRAMEIIAELEPEERGIYTGSIFSIDPDGNLDSSIAIRTIVKRGDRLHLQVGGGIVYDSILEAEYQEAFDKASALTDTLKA